VWLLTIRGRHCNDRLQAAISWSRKGSAAGLSPTKLPNPAAPKKRMSPRADLSGNPATHTNSWSVPKICKNWSFFLSNSGAHSRESLMVVENSQRAPMVLRRFAGYTNSADAEVGYGESI
jgi:hypothetical protein